MKHGGKRAGSGRPAGSGKYKVPTKTMRIPVEMTQDIADFIESKGYTLPFFSNAVEAGIPSPVSDESEPERINLHTYLVENAEDTFFLKANGDSMIEAGIHSGDVLVVNKKTPAKEGAVVVASVNGEFTVKRLSYKGGKPFLMPENKNFKPIPVNEHDDVVLFGVVTHSIRSHR
jgi:DNA polymerase V